MIKGGFYSSLRGEVQIKKNIILPYNLFLYINNIPNIATYRLVGIIIIKGILVWLHLPLR